MPRLRADREFSARLVRQVESNPAIAGVRVNHAAASIVVRYAPTGREESVRTSLAKSVEAAATGHGPAPEPAQADPSIPDRRRRLAMPGAIAAVAALARLFGLTLPTPLA
ncbi:MAG: hypothetical protein M3N16_05960, partial [Actinomycetota bacterium]|nr:hypothetical protein [Actinomycetota bacterium]